MSKKEIATLSIRIVAILTFIIALLNLNKSIASFFLLQNNNAPGSAYFFLIIPVLLLLLVAIYLYIRSEKFGWRLLVSDNDTLTKNTVSAREVQVIAFSIFIATISFFIPIWSVQLLKF